MKTSKDNRLSPSLLKNGSLHPKNVKRFLFGSQSGFAIAGTLILLAILAVLSLSMLMVFRWEQEDLAREAQTLQVYQAAKTGMQVIMYQKLINGTLCTGQANPVIPAINNIRYDVSCQKTVNVSEGGINANVETYVSIACNDTANNCPSASPKAGYIEREIRATMIK